MSADVRAPVRNGAVEPTEANPLKSLCVTRLVATMPLPVSSAEFGADWETGKEIPAFSGVTMNALNVTIAVYTSRLSTYRHINSGKGGICVTD